MTTPFNGDNGPSVGGVPLKVFYEGMIALGVPKAETGKIIGGYFEKHPGITKRTFVYSKSVPTSTGCASSFTRTFSHALWKDGRDLVQAEETTLEEGFNRRFLRIQDDLQKLGDNVAQSFACLNALRDAVKTMFDDVRGELNAVNSDLAELAECCEDGGRVFQIDPTILGGRYLGTTKYFGTPVHAFATKEGVVTLPIPAPPVASNPRVLRPAELAKFFSGNRKVEKFFEEGPHTKDDFLAEFGEVETDGGWLVKDLVEIIPDGRRRYSSAKTLLSDVHEREAGALRTEFREEEFELPGYEAAIPGETPIGGLEFMPEHARSALEIEGVETVEELSKLDNRELASLVRRHGIEASSRDAAGWIAAADLLTRIR